MEKYIVPVLVAFITAVIGPVIVDWVSRMVKEKNNRTTPIQEALEFGESIDNQLTALLEELKCSGVWIAQFHNGELLS